jgi:hypothetical protein
MICQCANGFGVTGLTNTHTHAHTHMSFLPTHNWDDLVDLVDLVHLVD